MFLDAPIWLWLLPLIPTGLLFSIILVDRKEETARQQLARVEQELKAQRDMELQIHELVSQKKRLGLTNKGNTLKVKVPPATMNPKLTMAEVEVVPLEGATRYDSTTNETMVWTRGEWHVLARPLHSYGYDLLRMTPTERKMYQHKQYAQKVARTPPKQWDDYVEVLRQQGRLIEPPPEREWASPYEYVAAHQDRPDCRKANCKPDGQGGCR